MKNCCHFDLPYRIELLPEDLQKEYLDQYLPEMLAEVECNEDSILDILWNKVYAFYLKKVKLEKFDWADIDYLSLDMKNEIILMEYCDADYFLTEPYSMNQFIKEINPDNYKNFMRNLKDIDQLLSKVERDDSGYIISGMQETELLLFLTNEVEKEKNFSFRRVEKNLYYNLVMKFRHIPELNNCLKIDSLAKIEELLITCISVKEKENSEKIDDLLNNYRLERLLNVSSCCYLADRLQSFKSMQKEDFLEQNEFIFIHKEISKGIEKSLIDTYVKNLTKAWTCDFVKQISYIPSVLCKNRLLSEETDKKISYNSKHILYIANFAFHILSGLYSTAIEYYAKKYEEKNEEDGLIKLKHLLASHIQHHKRDYDSCLNLLDKSSKIKSKDISKAESANIIYSIYGNAHIKNPVFTENLEEISTLIDDFHHELLRSWWCAFPNSLSFPNNFVAAEVAHQKELS